MSSAYARLPAVSVLIEAPELAGLPHRVRVRAAREAIEAAREAIRTGGEAPEDLAQVAATRARALRRTRLRPVINATGIVVHTNLGRAPLHPEVAAQVAALGGGYGNLELHLDTGRRGGRLDFVKEALAELTGAESAVVVNNCAAAVLLALTALARDREVLVSRGELVEIGGSFRVPDVVSAGGARLVEVGTTNRTRVADFAAAMTEHTAVMLRVHPSNFRQLGFVERPERTGLVALARERGVPLVEDLGSGLLQAEGAGLPEGAEEDAVDRVLAEGVDLACFSGDKLLGGPQAGIVVGRADLVERLRRHPLYRALRLDKLGLMALEATLQLYREGRGDEVPVRAMLARPPEELRRDAAALAAALPGARVASDVGYSGGGALPARPLEAAVVELDVADPQALALALRTGDPAVMARVARDRLVLDPRTLLPGQVPALVGAVKSALLAVSRADG